MKNLFTLTVLLMMQSTFSQIIPTKLQENQIKQLTTPSRLIEYSKGLSNEKRLIKEYDSLVNIIKERDKKIASLITEHRNTLIDIAMYNNSVNSIDDSIEEIQEEFKENFFKSNFHLYSSVEVPQLEFNKTILSGELMLDLKVIEVGAVLNSFPAKNRLDFNYGLKLRYKFF